MRAAHSAPVHLHLQPSPEERPAKTSTFSLLKQCLDELFRVEFSDVFRFFAQADKFYRDIELVFNGDDDAAASGAVQLG